MEFKEAYKKGLKVGKAITNGEYNLQLENIENFGGKYLNIKAIYLKGTERFYFDMNRLFFDSLEDNWEILEE